MKKIISLSILALGALTIGTTTLKTIQPTHAAGDMSSSSSMKLSSSSSSDMSMSKDGTTGKQVSLKGLKKATKPAYKKGEKVTVLVDHKMPGEDMKMKGAPATIVAGYHTRVYEVDFHTTDNNTSVKNHKWVIQREIKGEKDSSKPLKKGAKVTLEANHMKGMKGAKATIVSSKETNVYIVNIDAYKGQQAMMNHRWFTQSELKARK